MGWSCTAGGAFAGAIAGGRAWPQEGGAPHPTSRHRLRAMTVALDAPPPIPETRASALDKYMS